MHQHQTTLRDRIISLLPYLALFLLGCALIVARVWATGKPDFLFLGWNLILAAIPLAASSALRGADRAGLSWRWMAPAALLWILFLPNAPYILTDMIHLRERAGVPMWYDLILLLTCAAAGVAFTYRSLLDVETVMARRIGHARAIALSVAALFLSGFGIYLGRFARLNSWDVVTEPVLVVRTIVEPVVDPLAHPRTWAVTMLFGMLLVIGYAMVRPRRSSS